MTTHIVCLDGTGQTYTQGNPTNIALIFKAMGGAIVNADNNSYESTLVVNNVTVQVGKYLAGVGTEGIELFKVVEQATSEGLAELIIRGYTFLSRRYQPGDDIMIVGFSRGAAAARCLAGFVVGQGLLNPANYDPGNKNVAYLRGIAAWYQYRAGQPWLAKQQTLTDVFVQLGETVPALTPADYVAVERILAVAVFDTVSSSGIPNPDDDWKYNFSFANTDLSPQVLNGFHALSADENRSSFVPTYWTPRVNVTQVIFPGAHSDVGGGYQEHGLSDRALQWMLPNLSGQGLRFDLTNIRALAPDPIDFAHDDGMQAEWVELPKAPRIFPSALFDGAPSFTADRSIGERWGKAVTVLQPRPLDPQAKTTEPYSSIGLFEGGGPLFP
jgi:uncharacterized protein (DUF2235 family)